MPGSLRQSHFVSWFWKDKYGKTGMAEAVFSLWDTFVSGSRNCLDKGVSLGLYNHDHILVSPGEINYDILCLYIELWETHILALSQI